MPITRTPMVDDDGSGTTGTIVNNAWKQELYNQIDALGIVGGTWVDLTYSAGNFVGNGSMTWTVDASDLVTYGYSMNGKIVTLAFFIQTTSVGGTLANNLMINLPWVSTRYAEATCRCINNGVQVLGFSRINSAENLIRFNLFDSSNWLASTNNTGVFGQLSFPIA
jgi:hypothetical protein